MPAYPTPEIEILLHTAAFKAGVEQLDKRGFQTLRREIKKAESPYEINISERYLEESIFKRVEKAKNNGQSTLNFSQNYVDTICHYIGYMSFRAFKTSYQDLIGTFSQLEGNDATQDIAIIYHKKDHKALLRLKDQLENGGLKGMYLTTENPDLNPETLKGIPLAIVISSNALPFASLGELISSVSSEGTPLFLPFVLEEGLQQRSLPEFKGKPVLYEENSILALSMVKANLKEEDYNKQKDEDLLDTKKAIQSSEGGANITGDHINIKGKYMALRDMNIQIDKTKKN